MPTECNIFNWQQSQAWNVIIYRKLGAILNNVTTKPRYVHRTDYQLCYILFDYQE